MIHKHNMQRPRFTDSERQRVFELADLRELAAEEGKTPGHCWHCGTKLTTGDWDVDHFPVPFRDIERRWIGGITDPKDPQNLVPSCKPCNRSHRFEDPKNYPLVMRLTPWCTTTLRHRLRVGVGASLVFAAGVLVGSLI